MADQYNSGSKLAAMDMQLTSAQSEIERVSRTSAPFSAEFLAALISDANLLMDTLGRYQLSLIRAHLNAIAHEEKRSTKS